MPPDVVDPVSWPSHLSHLTPSATYNERLWTGNALRIMWSPWLGNERSLRDALSGSLRLRCHKRCCPLDHGLDPEFFRRLCPNTGTVCEVSARFVSAADSDYTSPSFSHHFRHALDRRVAVDLLAVHAAFLSYIRAGHIPIRGISTSFRGLFFVDSATLRNPTRRQRTFPRCVCGRYCRCSFPRHNSNVLYHLFIMPGPIPSSTQPQLTSEHASNDESYGCPTLRSF
jgi:hypothetical protein